ncbi:trace amine-associated receptor 1-like [Anneissia japonica]|uniref:trace amine-associated receptor 1-like n=1 Tax=Anneissia japonica TaxID=1529436 RepID=UPI0014258EB4|nr:trace amine-associated receptor 1-like [Anneissia japonica]
MVNNTDLTICLFPKALSIPSGFVTLGICIGNVFVIVSVYSIRSLRKPCYIILASMALVDVLTGIFGFVAGLLFALHGRFFYFGDTVGWLLHKVMVSTIALSLLHHLLLAGDRYFAIMYPYMYIIKVHNRSVMLTLIATWTIVILGLIVILSPYYSKDVQNVLEYTFMILVSTQMYAFHLRIYCKAKKTAGQVSSSTCQAVQNNRSDFKAARITSIILGAFSICILPSLIHSIVIETQGECGRCRLPFYVCSMLAYANSMLNPIVYGISNKTFSDSYKKIFQKIFQKIIRLC